MATPHRELAAGVADDRAATLARCASAAERVGGAVVPEVREVGRDALDRHPEDAEVMLAVGSLYLTLGLLDDALKVLSRAERLQPGARAHRLLGEVLLRQGEAVVATAMLGKALKDGDDDPDTRAWHESARSYRDMERLHGAAAVAEALRAREAAAMEAVPQSGPLPRFPTDPGWGLDGDEDSATEHAENASAHATRTRSDAPWTVDLAGDEVEYDLDADPTGVAMVAAPLSKAPPPVEITSPESSTEQLPAFDLADIEATKPALSTLSPAAPSPPTAPIAPTVPPKPPLRQAVIGWTRARTRGRKPRRALMVIVPALTFVAVFAGLSLFTRYRRSHTDAMAAAAEPVAAAESTVATEPAHDVAPSTPAIVPEPANAAPSHDRAAAAPATKTHGSSAKKSAPPAEKPAPEAKPKPAPEAAAKPAPKTPPPPKAPPPPKPAPAKRGGKAAPLWAGDPELQH